MALVSLIKHGFYINLSHREDRNEHVLEQISKIGLNSAFTRFNAIEMENGAVGCALSHIKCIQAAKELKWPHVLILEDDVTFLDPGLIQTQLERFIKETQYWDVVILAGNNGGSVSDVSDYSAKVSRCQTTTAYLVRDHYYDALLANMKAGLQNLLRYPGQHVVYAIDKYWFTLQQRDAWYLILPLTVIQREDYSDIEKRNTNYMGAMLTLIK